MIHTTVGGRAQKLHTGKRPSITITTRFSLENACIWPVVLMYSITTDEYLEQAVDVNVVWES